MKRSFRKKIASLLKGAWHILAIILLLSLPTFSFFMPGFEMSDLMELAIGGGASRKNVSAAGPSRDSAAVREAGYGNSGQAGFTRLGSRQGGDQTILIPGRRTGSSSRQQGASGCGGSGMRDIISGRDAGDRSGEENGDETSGSGSDAAESLLESALSELESLEEAVKNLSSGYASQGYSGSGSGRYINPFLRSLANSSGDGDSGNGDTGGDTGGGDSGGGSGGDSGGGDSGGGDSGGGGGDDQNDDPETRIFDSILIGDFLEDQQTWLMKASSSGSGLNYYLEDGSMIDASYSIIWSQLGFVVESGQGELIVTSDFDGDNREELLVVENREFGDVLTCWTSRSGKITESFSGSFPYRSVTSLDFFDWDSDGTRELVVAFENSRNLHIYDVNNKSLRYSREFKLPFEPSVLISTATTKPFKTGYLHVGGAALEQYVLFNSRYPGVYSFMSPTTLAGSETVELESMIPDAEGLEFLGVEYVDRLMLLVKYENEYRPLVSLGLRGSKPSACLTWDEENGLLGIILGF